MNDLRKKAKNLEPVLRIGKNGINDNVLAETRKLLKKRKLIKIKILNNCEIGDKDLIINIITALRTFVKIIQYAKASELISYHASNRAMCFFGPLVYIVARLKKKPVVMRIFGGSFHEYYKAKGNIWRWILGHSVLSSDLCLFETKESMRFFRTICSGRVEWFSNYTRDVSENRCEKDVTRRL